MHHLIRLKVTMIYKDEGWHHKYNEQEHPPNRGALLGIQFIQKLHKWRNKENKFK
jgi:hypothetical protein